MDDRAPSRSVVTLNRRAHSRYVLVGQPATLYLDGEAQPCTVRNISSAGLMAGIFREDLTGEKAEIEFRPGERIPGSILWVRDWQIGFGFDDMVDVERLLDELGAASGQADRRADRRVAVDCAGKLRVNGRYYFGRIGDISCAGARFRTGGTLKKTGASLLIAPDLPPLKSMIRWARDGEFGLEFLERLPPAALDQWVAERTLTAE
jgi:hypothetical protein